MSDISVKLSALIDVSTSTTISDAIDLAEMSPTHLVMPATFTGTAITFQGSDSKAGTFVAVYDAAGSAVTVTVSTSRIVALGQAIKEQLKGLRYLKLVSGSAENADRTVGVIVR